MTTHNPGSSTHDGGRWYDARLDWLIHKVLDRSEEQGYTVGEALDRVQHVAACRSAVKEKGETLARAVRAGKRRRTVRADPRKAKDLRLLGIGYREIAMALGCSVGTVHDMVNKPSPEPPESLLLKDGTPTENG